MVSQRHLRKRIFLLFSPVYKHGHCEDDEKDEEDHNGNHLVHCDGSYKEKVKSYTVDGYVAESG